jgi:hypothetical protein
VPSSVEPDDLLTDSLFQRHEPTPRATQGEFYADYRSQQNIQFSRLNLLQVSGTDSRDFSQFLLG